MQTRTAIERLRQARGLDELAETIEPLAQAMAALTDETRETLERTRSASRDQAATWASQQQAAAAAWTEAARQMQTAAEAAQQAARRWTWRLWALSAGAAILPPLALLAASWLWLGTPVIVEGTGGSLWMRLG